MKQLLQNLRSGETTIVEAPIPTPQTGEALIKTCASLVSAGTERMVVEFAEKSLLGKARSRPDLVRQVIEKARREGLLTTVEAAFNRLDQPMPLGYSSAGVVVEFGPKFTGFQKGQRVACAGGGYAVHAEYACVPNSLLTPLPAEVDFESAAFTTLGAIALHGYRLAETQLGERVGVIGLGLLGLLAVSIIKAAGCHVMGVDLDPARVSLAVQLGAEAVLRDQAEEAAQAFSRGRGCDAVLICADSTSSDPVELAGLIARDRARVIAVGAVGLQIPRKIYFEKELTFINSRSYGPGRYDPAYEEGGQDYPIGYVRWTEGRNMEAFVDLLASGKVNVQPLITHRFPIDRAPEAYELITGRVKEPFLGIVLQYPGDESGTGETNGKYVSAKIAPAAAETPSQSRPSPTKPRIGVLGAGNFATAVLLPAMKKVEGLELIGVASASGLSAQHAANRFGFRYASSNEKQIIEDPNINTVAILTRHHLHAAQVLAALAAGKHVFCEKPLAINPDEMEAIRTALERYMHSKPEDDQPAQQHLPLLTVGFNRRFAPLAHKLSDFFIGRQEPMVAHYRINAGYIPLSHWLHDPIQGGGRIIGEGCHFIDFLTFLIGEPPVSVNAQGLPDHGRYREDNVVLTFTFPDGSIGTVSYVANGEKAFPKERVEVFCSGKAAALDDFRSLELADRGRRSVTRSRLRQDKGHLAEWHAFATAIAAGGPPPIPYSHIFGVMEATFASVHSLRSRQTITWNRSG
jgi:predicted dehydrogenase/threonine dehydrogenase-like Zn-dependent dehydrogenase